MRLTSPLILPHLTQPLVPLKLLSTAVVEIPARFEESSIRESIVSCEDICLSIRFEDEGVYGETEYRRGRVIDWVVDADGCVKL